LTGKPFSLLQENSDVLKEQLKNVKGHLDIRAFPTRGLSVTALEGFIERVSQVRKIDLIVLDYADLMDAGKKSTGNTYDDMGTLYEELRGISGNLGIPLWTATQTNRDSCLLLEKMLISYPIKREFMLLRTDLGQMG